MNDIEFREVSKSYGNRPVLSRLSFQIEQGERVSDREIHIGPERRNLGMVFQDLALWPHFTVYQNLEFALKARSKRRAYQEIHRSGC